MVRNNGLFSTLFLDDLKSGVELDDMAQGRMATLANAWKSRKTDSAAALWDSFLKQALGYLEFVPAAAPAGKGVYPLYENWDFADCLAILYLVEPGSDLDDTAVGRFWPAKLVAELKKRKLNWGILTDGATWRLYSLKSSRPFEDYVELPLAQALEESDEAEYGLFEHFFHTGSFVWNDEGRGKNDECGTMNDECTSRSTDHSSLITDHSSFTERNAGVYTCRLDEDRDASEAVLEEKVKKPLLAQVDEALQYICNGFIFDTRKSGEEYTEEERREIFESAVKLLYRCLFLFYAEARRLLPSESAKSAAYRSELSIHALCEEARKFKWGRRDEHHDFDLWQHLKGLVAAVNDGDSEYGIMGYNGGLFDDSQEKFLGEHRLRNDFLARALYLLAYVEPYNNDADEEYEIPYEDLEVRHLGELYENILEFNVSLCDADRLRRRTKKGVQILLASENARQEHDTPIRKGEVYFGESALERKQTGSYYTPESLVRFLNEKAIIAPLRERFDADYRPRFEQFLDSIGKGVQQADVKGAARSAAAQVRRFVDEVVLKFRVCDPAMGSGHFLVDAANQMAGLVVEILAEIHAECGMMNDESSGLDIVSLRRRITRNCLYGVDLNRLAVNLAKLSLWLNCFATNHKLTFLDHHLRCGNSLIGLRTLDQLKRVPKRKKDGKKKPEKTLFDLDDLSVALSEAAERFAHIAAIDEDDTDRQKEEYDQTRRQTHHLAPLADLFTAYLMDSTIERSAYERIFNHFSGQRSIDPLSDEELRDAWSAIGEYRSRHDFFHWALEFPDVMGGDRPGFDATVGNPPWDVLQPNSQEFYLEYDGDFRKYQKQEAIKVVARLHENNPALDAKWRAYEESFAEASTYFKQLAAYETLTQGKIDLYKAFLERFYAVLRTGGRLGIVTPSGLYTDQGCLPLRKLFFDNSQIQFLYGFENRSPAVFSAVDGRFKFITFCTRKGGRTELFKCAFMQHDPERLPAIHIDALKITVKQVKKFSPDTLSVMEFDNQKEIEITDKIYSSYPLLGDFCSDSWNVSLSQDFNRSADSHLFNVKGEGLPLIEGKCFFQFDYGFSPVELWIREENVREKFLDRKWRELLEKGRSPSKTDEKYYRGAFRRIAASTNERTMVATVLPANTVCPHTVFSIQRVVPDSDGVECHLISSTETIWLVASLNSVVVDFTIRHKISTGLDMHFVYTLPVPRVRFGSKFFTPVVVRALRLMALDSDYSSLWEETFLQVCSSPELWYPPECDMNYGPAHEREVRARLAESAKSLTPEWTLACGVHDRLPDRRDTGDRAQLRAEIDAYVAHLYGLSRDDFAYILDTFPVLRRKEMKAFGEFMSKRKCLEEYDRLSGMMNDE